MVSEAEDASQQQNFTAKGKKRATGSSDEDADGEYEDEDDENMADLDAVSTASIYFFVLLVMMDFWTLTAFSPIALCTFI